MEASRKNGEKSVLSGKKKEINNKEKKKVSEESCFQRKQCARITTSVFAFLANESTALLYLGQPEAGKKLQNRPFDLANGKRRLFFFGPIRSKAPKFGRSYDSNPLRQTASNVP